MGEGLGVRASGRGVEIAFNNTQLSQLSTFNFQPLANRGTLPDVLKGSPISPTDTVAQASSPASSGSVPLPGSIPVGTIGQPAAGTAALRKEFTLPNVVEIIAKSGGAVQLRNAVKCLQAETAGRRGDLLQPFPHAMMTFRNRRLRDHTLPMSTAWLLKDIAEAKGKQELFTRQSPQILKTLRQMALIQSTESSNRIALLKSARDIRRKDKSLDRLPMPCSAAVRGCGFEHRLGARAKNWRRDAPLTRRRERLRYVHA